MGVKKRSIFAAAGLAASLFAGLLIVGVLFELAEEAALLKLLIEALEGAVDALVRVDADVDQSGGRIPQPSRTKVGLEKKIGAGLPDAPPLVYTEMTAPWRELKHIMKHGSVGVTLLCIGCSIGLGSYFARGPWDEYREQQRQTELARRELRKIEDQRANLIRQTTRNSSRQGEEELLRERGHYRVDERPLYEVLDN